MRKLRADFAAKSHRPSDDQMDGLEDVVSTAVAMADGTCRPAVYLSSLDPGVGKTTAVVQFIQQLLKHPDYDGVSVLMCLPRLEEIKRVVSDLNLASEHFAVLTRDDDTRHLSSTPAHEARILLTTHQMVEKRCQSGKFTDVEAFWYRGRPRDVRIWDEAMLPGEVLAISTDDIGHLINVVKSHSQSFGEALRKLQGNLSQRDQGDAFEWPDLVKSHGSFMGQFASQLNENDRELLDKVLWLSSRITRVARENGRKRTALDNRDMLPQDFQPVLVLDASGRVRSTYKHWEKHRRGLVRLRSAAKRYGNLCISVLDRGAGGHAWQGENADQLLAEIATVIRSKPCEPWLIVHHGKGCAGQLEQRLRALLPNRSPNVSFLPWGQHQGTNDYGHISNVILAGTLFYPESQYEGLSYLSTGQPMTDKISKEITDDIRQGEHCHLVVQALCRASVRGSDGPNCNPCNAYIIAAIGSGIRNNLNDIFPGCAVKDWKSRHKPLKGQVANAVAYLEGVCRQKPIRPVPFSELMEHLAIPNKANFNKTIRKHAGYIAALDRLGLQEVSTGGGRYHNAIAPASSFDPIPEASYRVQ